MNETLYDLVEEETKKGKSYEQIVRDYFQIHIEKIKPEDRTQLLQRLESGQLNLEETSHLIYCVDLLATVRKREKNDRN